MKRGTLYGVSVGPGDPELMTLKAAACIRRCGVLAAPRTAGGNSLALSIAAGAVDMAEKEIEYLDLPMSRDPEELAASRGAAAARIAVHLDAGRDVALLTLGDASLYSSCAHLCRILLEHGYDAETIPGVTSFCACAALLNRSLAEGEAPLHILPASMPDLPAALALPGGKVVMKAGRALPEVKRLLCAGDSAADAALVTDCGLPTQRVCTDLGAAADAGYFTTLLLGAAPGAPEGSKTP